MFWKFNEPGHYALHVRKYSDEKASVMCYIRIEWNSTIDAFLTDANIGKRSESHETRWNTPKYNLPHTPDFYFHFTNFEIKIETISFHLYTLTIQTTRAEDYFSIWWSETRKSVTHLNPPHLTLNVRIDLRWEGKFSPHASLALKAGQNLTHLFLLAVQPSVPISTLSSFRETTTIRSCGFLRAILDYSTSRCAWLSHSIECLFLSRPPRTDLEIK
jgi:hypothetical protein